MGYAGCATALARYLQSSSITDLATKNMLEEAHRLFFDSKHYNKLKVHRHSHPLFLIAPTLSASAPL